MTSRNHVSRLFGALALVLCMSLGCGEDVSTYQSEILNLETPLASKTAQQKKKSSEVSELDLKEDEASNFGFVRIGDYIPWIPYPIYDYYLQPVPVAVPVSWWGYSVIEFVHPFYAPIVLDDWGGGDWDCDDCGNDDGGFAFRVGP